MAARDPAGHRLADYLERAAQARQHSQVLRARLAAVRSRQDHGGRDVSGRPDNAGAGSGEPEVTIGSAGAMLNRPPSPQAGP